MSVFAEWVCVFPGNTGISWKMAHNVRFASKAEAESKAAENCNVVAIPLELWKRYKEYEHRCVAAEGKLLEVAGLRLDYIDGQPTFIFIPPPNFAGD